MSQHGVLTTTIILAEGQNALRPILSRLATERPKLVKCLPPMSSMWEEIYEISPEGCVALAASLQGLL